MLMSLIGREPSGFSRRPKAISRTRPPEGA